MFTSFTKRERREFDVVVVQRRQTWDEMYKKSVMHVQSCCFAFLPFLDSLSRMLSAITLADGQASIHRWIYRQVGAVIDKPTTGFYS